MSDRKEIVIIGYSGHGLVVTEAALDAGLIVQHYADKRKALMNPFNLSYLGFENDAVFSGWGNKYQFILGVGNNKQREAIAKTLVDKNEDVLTVLHPTASISSRASIGIGVFAARNVSVNTLAVIGNYTILNTGAVIDHECQLGTSVHVGPGAVLAGNIKIGDRSFIGANSVIKQGITVGKDVIIGAGSVVIADIFDGGKFAGNPAKQIR